MRITGPSQNQIATAARSVKERNPRNEFSASLNETESAEQTISSPPPPPSLAGLDAFINVQTNEDVRKERRRAASHGRSMLDILEQLRIDFLAGKVDSSRLDLLANLLKKRQSSDDRHLESLMDDIELRARVELAKLGR